jgi:hypothetical protein
MCSAPAKRAGLVAVVRAGKPHTLQLTDQQIYDMQSVLTDLWGITKDAQDEGCAEVVFQFSIGSRTHAKVERLGDWVVLGLPMIDPATVNTERQMDLPKPEPK